MSRSVLAGPATRRRQCSPATPYFLALFVTAALGLAALMLFQLVSWVLG